MVVDIYNEDCITRMIKIADNSIDLTVTSPPYDNLRNYSDSLEWNFDVFKNVANNLLRITNKGGVIVWVVGDATINGSESLSSFKQALYFNEIGLNLHDTMIYHKDNAVPVGGSNRYFQAFEYMFVFSKGTPKTFNPITVKRRNKHNDKRTERYRGVVRNADGEFVKKIVKIKDEVKKQNIWTYTVGGGNSTKDGYAFKHPAIFPEQLAEDQILSWSNEGDTVFDPFMGSGTTGKMAQLNNRNFIGTEKVKEYYDISCERLGLNKSKLDNLFV